MTLTKHGHHIPGTKTDDEDAAAVAFNCRGPQHCAQCYWEWRNTKSKYDPSERKKQVMPEKLTIGANASGAGKLKVADLKKLLLSLPDAAVLTIHAGNDQREGDFWRLSAEWGEDDVQYKNQASFHSHSSLGIGATPRSSAEFHEKMQPRSGADQHFGPGGVGTPFGS